MLERMKTVEKESKSESMCLAKWLQSTVYLMNGHTHSCHHPAVHKIPLEEIKDNPSALHNTQYKMQQREAMLKGQRPPECQYCWNIEDLGKQHISDRTYKSTDEAWAFPNLQKVLEMRDSNKIAPTYLEVAFENLCNMKCMYCTPDISSKWMEEISTHGPYMGTSRKVGDLAWLKKTGKYPMGRSEENPYIDAFWKWWPELYQNLKTFRITGGEPLLSKNTWRVLEEIKNNPRADFSLAINTNMQAPDELIERLIDYYNDIAPKIKNFDIYTSCEAHGKHAEYIRTGMNYDSFLENINKYLRMTGSHSRVHLMITFNILSLSTFDKFLEDVLKIRREFSPDIGYNRVPMMINYLMWPQFQNVRVAPAKVRKASIERIMNFVNANSQKNGNGLIYLEEVDQIERLSEYAMQELDPKDLKLQVNDFRGFFNEFDRRRKGSFLELFPELRSLYSFF
jgi:organic radical activating enzyme